MPRALIPLRWLERLADDRVDGAALDGLKTLLPRLVIASLASLLLLVHLGPRAAIIWISFVGFAELWCRQCSNMLARQDGRSLPVRLNYIASALATTIAWTSLPVLLWWSKVPDIGSAVIVMLISQLIHAQAFAFRAPAIVAFKVGVPALAMLALPWLVGSSSYFSILTSTIASGLCIGYIYISIRVNLRGDAALRKAHDELEYLAYFDALTSLANRRQFTLHMRTLIELSDRQKLQFALLLIDLDHFKVVNDTFGHDAGDALLVAAGERLRAVAGDLSYVARLGGDEFAILIPDVGDTAQIDEVCGRIGECFQPAVDFNGERIYLSSSVGIALYPGDGLGIETIFKSADVALYEAKRSGRGTWRFSYGLGKAK
ncbi:GGDEF domain-containing protein [Sphingomonas sp. PAMC26645]|uniref:GGDEF domain-containing protein n=1 Tax=Sphingomonas sp. PAMC26645 TaxID=2565555 RepID=UPI001FFB58A1|nr:GGDEF domain-containing protein [Sphingomonas sp. PAMC26645]